MTTTVFTPFNDTLRSTPDNFYPASTASVGMDTSGVDGYRQGVEINTNRQRFYSTQPKMWSGDLDHAISPHPIGQARSFVEYTNTGSWKDTIKFDPTLYLQLGPLYPLPIVFNDGPAEQEEASLMPLTIPFRIINNEGPVFAHRIRGQVEDGNNFDTAFKNSNRTTMFKDYVDSTQPRPFLDEGQAIWGSVTGINISGYIFGSERLIRPYDDTAIDVICASTRATSDLYNVLVAMSMDLAQDFRPSKTRSSNANTFVYGRDSAIYGTDSIAFMGNIKGS